MEYLPDRNFGLEKHERMTEDAEAEKLKKIRTFVNSQATNRLRCMVE